MAKKQKRCKMPFFQVVEGDEFIGCGRKRGKRYLKLTGGSGAFHLKTEKIHTFNTNELVSVVDDHDIM